MVLRIKDNEQPHCYPEKDPHEPTYISHTHIYIYTYIYICICVIIFAYIVHILWMEDILHQPVGGLSQIRVLTVFHMFHNYCIVTNWCRDLSIHTA